MRRVLIASLAVLPAALTVVACSSPPEQPILNQFFRAARLRDTTSLASFATARFDPNTHGTVSSFDITNVSAEERRPLPLRTLAEEHASTKAEEAEFSKRKSVYQNENLEAINRVLKAEASGAKVTGKDAEVQAAWTRLRDETSQYVKAVSDAERKLKSGGALVRLSLDGTGADPLTQDGELVSKDVTISANVRLPDGTSTTKTLVVTMQRAVMKGDPEVQGKWIIESIRDTAAAPETKTS